MEGKEVSFEGFSGGWNVTVGDGSLGTAGARALRGVKVDYEGALRHAGNFTQVVAPNANHHILSHIRYSYNGTNYLIYAYNDSTGGHTGLYFDVFNESTSTVVHTFQIWDAPNTAYNADFAQFVRFVEVNVDPALPNKGSLIILPVYSLAQQAIDGVWNQLFSYAPYAPFLTNPPERVGQSPPLVAPAISADPTGPGTGLDSTGLQQYTFAYTIHDSNGFESSMSPFSAPITLVNAWAIYTIRIADLPGGILPQTAEFTGIGLYRMGGMATEPRFSALLQVQPDPTNTYVWTASFGPPQLVEDKVPEASLSLIVGPVANDPPPRTMTDILLHQDRLWGIQGSKVWFSREGLFSYWGTAANGTDSEGGYAEPDGNDGDPFNAISSEGALLLLGRSRSVYALYGNTLESITFDKRSTFGNINRLSLFRVDNDTFFYGTDLIVHHVNDISSPTVSHAVEKIMHSLAPSDVQNVCGAYWRDDAYFSVPIAFGNPYYDAVNKGLCFAYNWRKQEWRDATHPNLIANYLSSEPNPVTGEMELLSAPTAGGIYLCDVYNNGTAGTNRPIDILTDNFYFSPGMVGRFVGILVEGSVISNLSDVLSVTLRSANLDPSETVSYTYPCAQTVTDGRLLYYLQVQPDMVGRMLSVEITGNCTALSLTRISFGMLELRELV